MLFGIVLKGMNALYFNLPMDLLFEFIPQIIFLSILFGYMNVMIFIKWSTDWSQDTSQAPSIISLLMKIFLNGGTTVILKILFFSLKTKNNYLGRKTSFRS